MLCVKKMQMAMEEALVRILTHRRSIDILRDVHAAKEQRKPYIVVFVGVNGVGKSTNLAKLKEIHILFLLFI
jgi:signal recognition particle receptor subunit alpha